MSLYGSQRALNTGSLPRRDSRSSLSVGGGGGFPYARSEMVGGNGYTQEFSQEGYNYTYSSKGGGGGGGQRTMTLSGPHQKAMLLQEQCQDALRRAEMLLQSGGDVARVEQCMGAAREKIDQLKGVVAQLRQMGQPADNVIRSMEQCKEHLNSVHVAMGSSLKRRSRASRGSSSWDEMPSRSYQEALAWITQQKRLIETSAWGDEPAAIEQQLLKHNRFHSSIQRSAEVDRAKEELMQKGDKASLYSLDQEWDTLQKRSHTHTQQLRELQSIIEEISREIMWVNEREEEELVFNWGHHNIDTYIPRKQESYSRLMSALEEKEKDLNKLKLKVDNLMKSKHPAFDKIQAYMDTLQTQWSWLLQITKCIGVHLKENAAYSQFFKEANDTYSRLQKDHENMRKTFGCSKNTPLPNLMELLKALEVEKERLSEHKQQVAHLTSKAKRIVRLKPRCPEEKSTSTVIVKALCDFKQDQKVICKDDEAILKDNSQRSKWCVTGPGGLDMVVPSVCLLVPPPNPLSIGLASKNEQYYEAIQALWSQFYINIKSLISWQYCIQDINRIKSLTITMLYKMRPEEYQNIIMSLERHYQEFRQHSMGSQVIADEDKRSIETQYTNAQQHYDTLVTQLPAYSAQQQVLVQEEHLKQQQLQEQQLKQQQLIQEQQLKQQQLIQEQQFKQQQELIMQQQLQQQQRQLAQQAAIKKQETKVVKQEVKAPVVSSTLLTDLSALRLRLEGAESQLTQYLHIPVGHTCSAHLTQLQGVQREVGGVRGEYERMKLLVLQEVRGMSDADKAQFLRSELGHIDQRISLLEGFSKAYLDRCGAVCSLQQLEQQVEDVVKVYEARLTEQETTSLTPSTVQEEHSALQALQAELREKQSLLRDMEEELKRAQQLNGLVDSALHKCDIDLCQHAERVGQLSDRWQRIQNQIGSRISDLDSYLVLLNRYLQSSSGLSDWIDATRKQLDTARATKIDDIATLTEHNSKQKELNSEIIGKRGTVECVQRDGENLVNAIKDYELQLASYSAGLETLLNIPFKRNLLQSPTLTVTQEVCTLQTRYMELLTSSADYYKYLGELMKNMEELKLRGTRISMLEEELARLREELSLRSVESLELQQASQRAAEALSLSQTQLLSLEESKRSQALNLDTSQDRLDELLAKVKALELRLEEEEHLRGLAEERYRGLKEELQEETQRSRTLAEEARRTRMELEKGLADMDREAEQLRLQLREEAQRAKEAREGLRDAQKQHSAELTEVRQSYEEHVSVSHTNVLLLQQQKDEQEALLSRSKEAQDEADRLRQALAEEQERRRRAEEEALLQRKAAQEEQGKRKRVEAQLEQSVLTVQEYTATLNALQRSQEEAAAELKQAWEEARGRQEELDRVQREQGSSSQLADSLKEQLRAVQTQLTSTQAQTRDETRRMDELQRLLEEKTRLLNESLAEVQRLQELVEKLTKERLQLEEEVRVLRAEQGELSKGLKTQQEAAVSKLTLQIQNIQKACQEHQRLLKEVTAERDTLRQEVEKLRKQLKATSADLQRSEKQCSELRGQKEALERRVKELEEELKRLRTALEEAKKTQQKLQQQVDALQKEVSARDAEIKRFTTERSELLTRIKTLQERPGVRHTHTQTDAPLRDASSIMFQGVCAQVSAQQLHDCGLLRPPTFEQLLKGERSVQEVDAQLQPALRGSKVIAGMAAGPRGKMTLADALKQKLLSRESALRLLEAQAATGGLMDPADPKDPRRRKTVAEGQVSGLLPPCSNERLLEAETACMGIRDPATGQCLGVGQAHRKGLRDEEVTLQLLQAQEAVGGGMLDPRLSVFLPRDLATDRSLLDPDHYTALNAKPDAYLHPFTQRPCSYTALQAMCTADPSTGMLLLPAPKAALTVPGLRADVPVWELVGVGLLEPDDLDHLLAGRLRLDDVRMRLRSFLRETGCIAGALEQPGGLAAMTLLQAVQKELLVKQAVQELMEAQVATGFVMDPRDGRGYTVEEAHRKGLIGSEVKGALLEAEKAVTGYSQPGGDAHSKLSLSEALERGVVERGYGLRLLGAQLATGGIVDPWLSVRVPPDTAVKRGLLTPDLRQALETQQGASTSGATTSGGGLFPDPNDPKSQTKLSYGQLMQRCSKQPQSGLLLLPASTLSSQKNTVRKRRVVIVDPDSGREMTVKQAYEAKLIDYETYVELAQQECEWEEITITAPDGTKRLVIVDRTQGVEYDIQELLERGVIRQNQLVQYRAGHLTLAQFMEDISDALKTAGTTSSSVTKTSTSTAAGSQSSTASGMGMQSHMQSSSTSGLQSLVQSSTSAGLQSSLQSSTTSGLQSSGSLQSSSSSSAGTQSAASSSATSSSDSRSAGATTSSSTIQGAATSSSSASRSAGATTSSSTIQGAATTSSSASSVSGGASAGVSGGASAGVSGGASGASSSSSSSSTSSITRIQSQTIATSSLVISSTSGGGGDGSSGGSGGGALGVSGGSLGVSGSLASGELQVPLSPLSPSSISRISSMSLNLVSPPTTTTGERNPVGAIFDSENLEKVSVTEAMSRSLVDNITGQRLLEAQACTGGLVCPSTGRRLSLQEAQRVGLVQGDIINRLRPAQKAYVGFSEAAQGGRRLSVAEAVKERWLPHEAGQRFMEFQQATGGLWDPQDGCRRSLEEAQTRGWIDARSAQKLADLRQHSRCLVCPQSRLKLSYAESLERCLLEESTGVMMLPAVRASSAMGSRSGSRAGSCAGSRSGSRRGSVDLSSPGGAGSPTSIYSSFTYTSSSSSYTTGS